jgi:hypothetical protein
MKILHQAAGRFGKARKYRHARTIAEIAGAAVLLSGGAAAASTLHAASSGNGSVIRGCANTKTGALSLPRRACYREEAEGGAESRQPAAVDEERHRPELGGRALHQEGQAG